MPRVTRLSGQLPSPPKSFDGSQSSETSCEISSNNTSIINKTRSSSDQNLSPLNDRKTRVLRRQSTQNVSGEIRAFFAVSALPSGKNKQNFLLSAVDRVSSLYDEPPPSSKDPPRRGKGRSQDDSDLPRTSSNDINTPVKKHWLTSGLYAGSRTSADNSKILSKGRKSDPGPGASRKSFKFALPMFHGKILMDQQRDFKLPWNLYATSGDKCKPPNWSRVRRNIYVDVDQYDKKADRPECLCRVECDEACLNRAMFYECDDQTCALQNPADCSNRTFQQAAIRYADHKARSCGFEVFNTGARGFGLRALRDFQPNAFILEYRGEVISTEECEHRMVTMYSGRSNYYFLNIDANTVLDAGRKGSEARFANHCCAPNARIEKWIVKGEPRIGVFAGKKGLEAGEEITYDYNFSWFEGAKEQKCMCGAETCRGFIGKRKAMPPPPKPDTVKKGKTVASKVKRVVQGRIIKVSKKKIKAQVKNGKIVKAAIVRTTKTKSKKVKMPSKVKKVKVSTSKKNTTSLGKRKQSNSLGKAGSPKKDARKDNISGRRIAKPRPKILVKSPARSPAKPIYDTVSHRSRKRNVH